jgi:bifunctional non-homologous end joining protein LigD
MFCEIVARLLLRDHGDIGTIERSVARRRGRVYLDYLQNRREQTVVPPYVVRPVKGATVSTPLEWDELRSGLEPSQFTIHNVPSRLEKLGDLFRDALREGQDLTSALDALSEM